MSRHLYKFCYRIGHDRGVPQFIVLDIGELDVATSERAMHRFLRWLQLDTLYKLRRVDSLDRCDFVVYRDPKPNTTHHRYFVLDPKYPVKGRGWGPFRELLHNQKVRTAGY